MGIYLGILEYLYLEVPSIHIVSRVGDVSSSIALVVQHTVLLDP